jgi:GNAT superfamily N-acetyltransferase
VAARAQCHDGEMTETNIRAAEPSDAGEIAAMVQELADYEREPDAVEATEADFAAALFGPDPRAHALIAEVDGAVAGMAIWFANFSTWKGRHGIWLEDLFVRPEHRRLGIGRRLLTELAATCAQRGWTRLEWAVLDWNEPAQAFYRSLGAAPQDEWTTWRVTGDDLAHLGRPEQGS